MRLLRRDIGKNKILLWFLGALMENYPGGHLCIGGYLPAWLFNYVMSYVLRYLLSLESTRRGVKTKMVQAVVCFADDFTMFGHFFADPESNPESVKMEQIHPGAKNQKCVADLPPDYDLRQKRNRRKRGWREAEKGPAVWI